MVLTKNGVYENRSFAIRLYLNGPVVDSVDDVNFPEPQILYVSADVNFDGSIDSSEWFESEIASPGYVFISFNAVDDGRSPGNGTPSDQVTVEANFVGDSETLDVDVQNVSPVIISEPYVSYLPGPNGTTLASVGVSFYDQGPQDRHRIRVSWGDGEVTERAVVYDPDETCEGHFSGSVIRTIQPGVMLIPLTVEVIDDDTGVGARMLGKMDVVVNNDDDNTNIRQDLFDRGFSDDDLESTNLNTLRPMPLSGVTGKFALNYDLNVIRIWSDQSKTKLILPSGGSIDSSLGIPTVPYTDQVTGWVEGIAPGESRVTISWSPDEPNPDGCWDGSNTGNVLLVRVWGIDLDIDSDNNGEIEHSEWEEEIEDHEFAIGKLLSFLNDIPNTPPTPVSIRLPLGLDPTVKIKLEGKVVEGASTGRVQLTNHLNVLLGQTDFDGVIGEFSLNQLGYDSATGEITIFAKSLYVATIAATKKIVDQSGKPDNRITASIVLNGLTVKDEVKLLLVRDHQAGTRLISDFYIHVNGLAHLRGAGVAQAVYENSNGSDSGKNFAMKRLSRDEVEKILDRDPMSSASPTERFMVPSLILAYLFDAPPTTPFPSPPPGFQAALYRDYVTGGYRLSFRGTELNWDVANDWIDNIRQGLFGNSPQYEVSILLAWAVNKLDTVKGAGFSLAGHSLGGGMASAAAIANSIQADAYNGAGVHPYSLFRSDHVTPIIPGTYPDFANAGNLINHFYAEARKDTTLQKFDCPDILTWVSRQVGLMPDPSGNLIPLEGLYNLDDDIKLKSLAAYLATLPSTLQELNDRLLDPVFYAEVAAKLVFHRDAIALMISTHEMENIFFGMLHNDSAQWNAYDDGNPQNR